MAREPRHLGLLALFRQGVQVKGLLAADRAVTTLPQDLGPGDYEFESLAPWEHLLLAVPTDGGIGIVGVLFGELRFGLSIMSELGPDTARAWHIETRQSRPSSGTLEEITGWLEHRVRENGSAARLHHDRPRGQVLGLERRAFVENPNQRFP